MDSRFGVLWHNSRWGNLENICNIDLDVRMKKEKKTKKRKEKKPEM